MPEGDERGPRSNGSGSHNALLTAIAFDLEAILVSDDRAFHDDPIPDLAIESWLLGTGTPR
jgi:hypothetical protein